MSNEELRLERARLRTEVRFIDAEIAKIQAENRLFRRCGFGSDVHEIKITALRAERADRLTALEAAQPSPRRRRPTSHSGLGSWLVLPAVLGAVVVQAFKPKRRRGPRPARV